MRVISHSDTLLSPALLDMEEGEYAIILSLDDIVGESEESTHPDRAAPAMRQIVDAIADKLPDIIPDIVDEVLPPYDIVDFVNDGDGHHLVFATVAEICSGPLCGKGVVFGIEDGVNLGDTVRVGIMRGDFTRSGKSVRFERLKQAEIDSLVFLAVNEHSILKND